MPTRRRPHTTARLAPSTPLAAKSSRWPHSYATGGEEPFGQENAWAGGITQPLFTGGRVGSSIAAAGAVEEAARAELEEARSDIALGVKEAYYAAALAARSVEIARAQRTEEGAWCSAAGSAILL